MPATAKVIDAAPRYRILQYPGAAIVFTTVGNIGFQDPPTTGAVWFDTLWRVQEGASLQPFHIPTETVSGPALATGSTCTPTEVQATGKHLLWSCGSQGPAGVVEIATRKTIALPAGQYLLGDNYVVRHDANGTLLRYDVTGGTLGEAVTLANFPRGDLADDRNITWAVDKFGGDVAWVDAGNAVHIVDPGVAPSAPVAVSNTAPALVDYPQNGTFTVKVELTRPINNTTLTITQVRTGQTVRAIGSAARVSSTTWDGVFNGDRAPRGRYRWSLAASADGVSTVLAGSTMYALYGDGNGTFQAGLKVVGTGWLGYNSVVGAGDLNEDGKNDLILRDTAGNLFRRLGTGQGTFGDRAQIGSGYQQYAGIY
ncbi:FlgD immunoglobulin-like domain containing protein [Paractinoplanes lichenicola]|uniref:FlgD/Vpr Ig-like domain-containing protein n=1 Tax=Paractinoplanes lichenicola TaxID=2802976 RepID=A0ABS1W2C7_9ACTN|nr:FlgD immunoglobulin-like domain containing protein [Actinoplanes lichenicola]MBL7260872.1 hypothetical protein [Actinoplanes lichenicola]